LKTIAITGFYQGPLGTVNKYTFGLEYLDSKLKGNNIKLASITILSSIPCDLKVEI